MLIIKVLIVFGKYLIELDEAKTATTLVKDVASIDASSSVPLPSTNTAHVLASLLGIALDANDVEGID